MSHQIQTKNHKNPSGPIPFTFPLCFAYSLQHFHHVVVRLSEENERRERMGKLSSGNEKGWRVKARKQVRSSGNKYLRPGTLAQLRCNKPSGSGGGGKCFCTDLGKKRVALLHAKNTGVITEGHNGDNSNNSKKKKKKKVFDMSPVMLSPVNLVKQSTFVATPRTPRLDDLQSESRLESLPIDLLVKILCHLHHDQLRAVFHVSQRIRKAVIIARQFHFNYTTPDRSRQELLSTMTPLPTEHWPFLWGDGKGMRTPCPHTPKAPRHGPRPPSRLKISEMRQVTAVLFPESAFPTRCLVPSVIPKPLCKSLASNRVLFYEDELCQAVAQNKLR